MDARLLNPLVGVAIATYLSIAWTSNATAQYYPSAQMIMPPPMAVLPQPTAMRGMGNRIISGAPMSFAGSPPNGAWPAPSLPASSSQPAVTSSAPSGRNGQAVAHSQNFIVFARDEAWAKQVSETAERLRKELAEHWLGSELPPWQARCPLHVQDGESLGASGETRFVVSGGQASDWMMSVNGTRERVLDSVLPHEISHTIFASHFARLNKYVPRWADEGAATTVENEAEKKKHRFYLKKFLQTGRGLSFDKMFKLKEYPEDILPLYAQGHSAVQFLIDQGGPQQFMTFLEAGMQTEQWQSALKRYYEYESIWEFQKLWNKWLLDGSPSDLIAYAPKLQKQGQATVITASTESSRPISSPTNSFANNGSLPTDPRSLELTPSHSGAEVAGRPVSNNVQASNIAMTDIPINNSLANNRASNNSSISAIPFDAGMVPINSTTSQIADSRTEGWFKTQLRQTSGQPATPIPPHNNFNGNSAIAQGQEIMAANGMTGHNAQPNDRLGSQFGFQNSPQSNSSVRPPSSQGPSVQVLQWEPSGRVSGGPTAPRY